MNAYEYSQSLGLTGTDADIVAQLQAIPRHRKNVYITGGPANTESVNLLHLLTARHRVMGMGPAQQWVGPLIDLESTNPTVAAIMSMLRPMLQVNDTQVYCADSDDAANMLNALNDVVSALTGKPVQVATEVALLSGGRIGDDYADLTPEQFAVQREAAESIALKIVALERVANTAAEAAREEYRKSDSTPQTIIAAAVAVLGGV